ncbi:MAG: PKD-like domain-containing protein, partial [Saprospiraceae bacterium]
VCPGAVVDVPFSGGPQGTVYHWENTNPAIGLAATGSTTTNLYFTAAQVSTAQTGTVTVTPVAGEDCAGDPVTFDITVTPSLNDPPDITVCPGDPVAVGFTGTGVNFNWTNSNPAIGLPGSGSGDLAFTAAGGAQQQTATITVTPSLGPCAPVPQTFTVTVRPAPSVNQPPNLAVCAGASVTANFTGSPGSTFAWTNSNPASGLGPSGTGNIAFVAADVGQTETATVTVTPDNGTCAGIPRTFDIRVKPLPLMLPPADATVCAESDLQVAFAGPPGATYVWTNSNPAIGLAATGAGDIAFTAANGPQQQTATVTVTPRLEGCDGPPVSFSVTVLPAPVVQVPADLTVCSGKQLTVQLTATPGASLVWTNSAPAIGLPAAGGGPVITFTAAQVDSLLTGLITVTPHGTQCTGLSQTFVIMVVRCCQTFAGALDTMNRTVCAPDSAFVSHFGNQGLGPGDTLVFILYSDSLDPLGSVLWVSDSLPIPFLPGVTQPDSTYFVAVVAGPLAAPDSVDAGAACFSLIRGPKVRWVARPTALALSPPEAVCRDGCVDVLIELKGHPPFDFSWRASMGGQVLLDRTETVAGSQLLLTICPADLGPLPPGGGMLDFGAYYLADRYCGCKK